MKKSVSLILALAMICLCFVGCGGNKPADTTAPSATQNAETPETTPEDTVDDTTPTPPATKEEPIKLSELSKYELIRPDKSTKIVSDALASVKAVLYGSFSVDMSARTDLYREGVEALKKGEFEILIGNTNRDESTEFISTLKRDDYGFAIINGKIVIAGRTDEGTEKAAVKFISVISSGDRSEIFFDNDNDRFIYTEVYEAEDVKINGVSAFDYIFVYPSANKNMEKEYAEALRDGIADVCGAYSDVVADTKADTSKPMIVIGDAKVIGADMKNAYSAAMANASEWQYYTAAGDGIVWINAKDARGITASAHELTEQISKTNTEITVKNEVKGGTVAAPVSVMSYNVFYNSPNDRKSMVLQMIRDYMPDLLGVQEATPQWMSIFKSELTTNGYATVGEGRDGGNSGEYNAIFYKTDKFDLISSGTKWLSDTPDVKGSRAESNVLPRIMTYAVLERKSDGMRFIYVNTHLDHTSDQVRIKQIGVLTKEIAKLPDLPVIITGDFNTSESQNPYNELISYGFIDCAKVAFDTTEGADGTFHGYSGNTPSRIDFIFGSPGNVIFGNYEVCDKKIENKYASDHHPVYAKAYIFSKNK